MKQFDVTGMTCAACSSRVEKAVSTLPGVSSCSVNLLTKSMSVEGDISSEIIIAAVEKAGYGANEKGIAAKNSQETKKSDKKEEKTLKSRLVVSLLFLTVLMYFSMGHMLSLPVPFFLENNCVGLGLVQLLLSLVIMIVNKKFFVNGFKGIINKSPNMDTLVSMGSGVSFLYSTVILFYMTYLVSIGKTAEAAEYSHGFYFESAAMILTLITVGKMLEERSKGKTTDAVKGLMKLAPETANILKDGKEVQINASEIAVGDVFIVRAGESIPADGKVLKGNSAVDESALTGESIPSEKEEGSSVSAGTINLSGYMECITTGTGTDTMLAKIIKTVSDAAASKAPVAKIADKVSGVFVPVVIVLAVITISVWLMLGKDIGFALARGISVLVISCPCALGLATPVAIMVGSGTGAKNGILYKTAASLEHAGKIKIVALDKTGTITKGSPAVTDIVPAEGFSEADLLKYAYSIEAQSEHPLAKAICRYALSEGIIKTEVRNFRTFTGNGISAETEDGELSGGNEGFLSKNTFIPDVMRDKAKALSEEGKTPMFFSVNKKLAGIIAAADEIKEDSVDAIRQMKNMGLYVVMLTGDNKRTAEAVGKLAGVDKVIAGVLPDGKHNVIASLQQSGLTAMVGDGINDAPALTKADVGIAIGAGSDIAIDSADIVLVKSTLSDAVKAIRLGRAVLSGIHQNLFWAFGYNIIGIPLAAGVFTSVLGWSLNPMFGAAAMSISSFLVVTNALRLNFVNLSSPARDRKIKPVIIQEEKVMTKTMKIEGMMCMHCEARVKKVLEALDGVDCAEVSHEKGTAVLTLSNDIADSVLTEAVTAQDYKVLDIE